MSKNNKPLIFITNDDGIYAKGIHELIAGVRSLGDIVVIAPDGARSGMSSAISSQNPIRLNLLQQEEGLTVYSCTGTPVDCVKLGINEILDRKPDLIISGINHGSNAAICVIYSGTIGAALEGCILGIPALGVSLTNPDLDADFSQAVQYGTQIAEKILAEGLPKGVCLNLNIPNISKVKGLKICTQTPGYWTKEFQVGQDPFGRTVYWLTGEFLNEAPNDEHNDEWALNHGYAALVPLQLDMTAHSVVNILKKWE
ncbi:MAG: 5'-nucleotidase SurE [Candidatus Ordinivivax streblomastigis]|uniref:5'-nucleotidase SurE n=1 Tax=Candidatus Ordinivivax streblomastigis TaxID=2540710 RepID=A0A5M8P4M2_9BACT|nr:MAG: 5'-nucleotidase SurE [Candidatus Ordinivivax streblomastigis]